MIQEIFTEQTNMPFATGIFTTKGVVVYIDHQKGTFHTAKGVFPKTEFESIRRYFIHSCGEKFYLGGDLQDQYLNETHIDEDAVDARKIMETWVCWHQTPPETGETQTLRLIDQVRGHYAALLSLLVKKSDYIKLMDEQEVVLKKRISELEMLNKQLMDLNADLLKAIPAPDRSKYIIKADGKDDHVPLSTQRDPDGNITQVGIIDRGKF